MGVIGRGESFSMTTSRRPNAGHDQGPSSPFGVAISGRRHPDPSDGDACLTLADGHAERVVALHMIEPRADQPWLDEGDAARGAEHERRSSAIDGRTTRHISYAVSQRTASA